MGTPANVLLLGTAEWDAPVATNQHYVARELGHIANITFVESLGLRTPRLNRADVVRMASRVRKAFGSKQAMAQRRPRPEGTTVVSPLIFPVHRRPTRALNRSLLWRATSPWLRSERPRVLWTFTPVTYGLESAADAVVYHCVDLMADFPGIDSVAVSRGERRLARRQPVAIASSQAVEDHLTGMGFDRITLLPNVADVSVFGAASRPAAQREPSVLFAGNLSVHKVDVPLLEAVAKTVQGHGELLLAGPLGAGGGGFGPQLASLQALGARYLGVLSPKELAEVAGKCSVGLIPYEINDYTRGVSPLKCFEYLASGLQVVSTRLPTIDEVAKDNPHVIAADAADLPAAVLPWLTSSTDQLIAARRASATEHSWANRGSILRELLTSVLLSN